MAIPWLLVVLLALGFADPTPEPSIEPTTVDNSDLAEEGQDQVAILKQINRVNEDGSYTFGYEAADGSFKIETRDVAGNVKGMFGFVDEGGELRRVSYSASNGTGFQSTGSPNVPPLVTPADLESTTRINLLPSSTTVKPLHPAYIFRSTTTEKPLHPAYIFGSTTTVSPSRPEVIQHIPKLRPTPASYSTEPTEAEEITTERRPVYGSQLPKKSETPNYITFGTTPADEIDEEKPTRRPAVAQLIRPRVYKKIVVTKRPVDPSTTAEPVTSTFYPVQVNLDDESNAYQREVDANGLTEPGLTTSSTEDSPDVYGGGPVGRPFPGGAYRAVFPQIPQYQRILQPNYLQNQYPYQPSQAADPRLQQQPLNNPYPAQGIGQFPVNPALANRYQNPSFQGQDPSSFPSNQQVPFGQGQGAAFQFPSGAFNYGRFQQNSPLPIPQNPQPNLAFQPNQGALGQPIAPQYPQGPPPALPPSRPTEPRSGQRLPTPTFNPAQGLSPKNLGTPSDEEQVQRPPVSGPPQPALYNQAYPNVSPYGPEQANPQMFLMEQLLRMLLAAQVRQQPPPQPPIQQLSPFQQALISVLGANNVPPEFAGRNYDPRYYGQVPFKRPSYDPRYQAPLANPFYGYQQDPYSQYQQPYNPYYPGNPINPYGGYSPNPYYQGNPQESLLRMFLGAGGRYPAPVPQTPIPQIQQSPAAFDRSQSVAPSQRLEPDIPVPASPVFGRRIPVNGNIVERSPVYSKTTTPSSRERKGSRNVQIIDEESTTSGSTTTTKPRQSQS